MAWQCLWVTVPPSPALLSLRALCEPLCCSLPDSTSPFLPQDHGGVIVNITATLSYRGQALQVHAGAAKAAIGTSTHPAGALSHGGPGKKPVLPKYQDGKMCWGGTRGNRCGCCMPGFGVRLFNPAGPFALSQTLLWLFLPLQKKLLECCAPRFSLLLQSLPRCHDPSPGSGVGPQQDPCEQPGPWPHLGHRGLPTPG